MVRCQLNNFPWEILHDVFDYLSPFDLFRSLGSINSDLTNVIASYSRLKVNCQSMRKSHFDLICEFLHVDQVHSLLLSDDRHTCGQMELFFSHFYLGQFLRLQFLTLKQISDGKLLELLFSALEDHRQIRSISIVDCSVTINRRLSRQITEILPSLPSLDSLRFFESSPLNTLRRDLGQLRDLRMDRCLFADLRAIIVHLPNLFSLHLSFPYQEERPRLTSGLTRLRRLVIHCQSWFTWSEVENFFSFFPSLESLIFESGGEEDLLDARRWQHLIERHLKQLRRLEMNIQPEENPLSANDVLLPFQHSFWINEKHCQFACLISTMTNTCVQLFTIPHFSPVQCWYPAGEGFVHQSLVPFVFEEHCTTLKVSHFPSPVALPSPLTRVRTLALQCSLQSVEQLDNILQLAAVRQLDLAKNIECRPLMALLQAGMNISQLTVYHQTLFPIISSDLLPVCRQIKELNVIDSFLPREIDRLCQVFPNLDDLSLLINDRSQILQVLDALPELKSALFRWPVSVQKSIHISREWLEEHQMTFRLSANQLELWLN